MTDYLVETIYEKLHHCDESLLDFILRLLVESGY